MKDEKLRPWSIVIAIIVSLLLFGLYIINPLKKDMEGGKEVWIAIFVCLSLNLLLSFIPYFRRNKNLARLIYAAVLSIVFGVLYFFIL